VVVPTYEREAHIARCLQSLVDQSDRAFEVVVVDNASTDETVAVAKGFSDRLDLRVVVNSSNRERSYSRNRGAEEARGEFVVFLDSDDELSPEAIASANALLADQSEIRFFFQPLTVVDASGAVVYVQRPRSWRNMRRTLARGNPLSCSGVFVERDLFLRHRFDESPQFVGTEDWHCWLRIAAEELPRVCLGGGALLVDHDGRSSASDPWPAVVQRLEAVSASLLADSAVVRFLQPNMGLFLGEQELFAALRAADQGATAASMRLFVRGLRHAPSLAWSRRAVHLVRRWASRMP